MGSNSSKFNKLKFPSYCVVQACKDGDEKRCLESWMYCVRDRDDITSVMTFHHVKEAYFDILNDMHANMENLRKTNFFICLVSIMVHKKINKTELAKLKQYKVDPTKWSAVGQALIIVLKRYYRPRDWDNELNECWIRVYSSLMRAVHSKLKLPVLQL